MKKSLSLLLCMFMLIMSFSSLGVSAAEIFIELDPLQYDEYMRGESIFVSGNTNAYVTLGLYYPEDAGPKFIMTYSPDELRDGISLETDTDARLWPDGTWTIIVQNGDVSEVLEFELMETVDRTEEPTEKPTSRPNGGNNPGGNVPVVTTIIPDKTELALKVGETEKINIQSTASSLSLEIDDENVISATLSGKTLTVTALKRGESAIWVKTNNNYASINVTVSKAASNNTGSSGEETTEKVTEPPTEPVTEKPTEEATDTTPVNPFNDIENHWAKESILSLYDKGIVNGMDEDTFAPDEYVTRAQFVTMLYKAFNLKHTLKASPFGDVDGDDWYFTYVIAAYENSITTGDDLNNFNPSNLVTRQDMAVFAYRTISAVGKGTAMGDVKLELFSDHNLISEYAHYAVYAMKTAGIINGMTDTTFEPLGKATRAQAAHIIAKLLEL